MTKLRAFTKNLSLTVFFKEMKNEIRFYTLNGRLAQENQGLSG